MKSHDMTPLGRTGLRVSRLGLGLASLGGMFEPVDELEARSTIDRAWAGGIRLFDTAPLYGYGRSEERAGAALRGRPRDDYVLCTKVGRLIVPDGPDTQPFWADPPPGLGPRRDYSYNGVMRSVEDSLARLDVGHVDVLHIHDPDEDYPKALTEGYRALDELRRSGAVSAVSLGVNHADVAARFLREAPGPGPDCVLLAGRYTVLDQSGLSDLLPLCVERGIAVMAAGVFQGGLLADPRRGAPHGYRTVPSPLAERLRTFRAACERYAVPPRAAALQFSIAHPAVATVVVGARKPDEVADNISLFSHPIPQALWTELKAVGLLAQSAPTP